jgi:FMN reductase
MAKVVLINGNHTKQSRLSGVHQYIVDYLSEAQVQVQSIFVHDLPAEDLIKANFVSDEIKNANLQVADADFVSVLTPIYKAAYSGILKTYLDLLPQKVLVGKKIIPVAVGGSLAHLLALEYTLKPVLSVLGATEILNSVYIVDKQIERLEDGGYRIEEEAVTRLANEQERKHSTSIKKY